MNLIIFCSKDIKHISTIITLHQSAFSLTNGNSSGTDGACHLLPSPVACGTHGQGVSVRWPSIARSNITSMLYWSRRMVQICHCNEHHGIHRTSDHPERKASLQPEKWIFLSMLNCRMRQVCLGKRQ